MKKEILNNNTMNKKIRIAIYSKNEFNLELLESVQYVSIYKSEMVGGGEF